LIEPDYTAWHRPVFSYPSVQAFLSTQGIENGIHAIIANGHRVDFLFRKKTSDSLLVVFGGAAPQRPLNKPPFFSGVALSENVSCSVMAINDPSLYLDDQIAIAWYAGSKDLPLQSILPAIIDKVVSTCASRTIMTGGSGGGFASLYYATETAQPSIAVVSNPQTNITKYDRQSVECFARVCFDWHEGNVESAFSGITYDLVKHYSEKKAPTIFLQNSADWHVRAHAIPFLRAYGLDWTGRDLTAEGLYLLVGNWGNGHIPAPKGLITDIINQLCRGETSLNKVVSLAHYSSHQHSFVDRLRLYMALHHRSVYALAYHVARHHRRLVP